MGKIRKEESISAAEATLQGRVDHLIEMDLAKKTRDSYDTAIRQYQGFMISGDRDPKNPRVRDICQWIAEESLFIKTDSVLKYIAGVRYHLDGYGKGHVARDVLVNRVVRGICKKYGFGKKDHREPIALELLVRVLKSVNVKDHDERCYAAACVIGFLHCLRIGEFTVSGKTDRYLRRSDWSQEGDKGCIQLRRCKTDIFGRGHELKYCKMSSILDPIFWMGNYARKHASWSSNKNEALFMLKDGSILSRSGMIKWFRSKAMPWCPDANKLNGISFRRGGAQVLRDEGYSMEEIGVLGRWLTMRAAARYVKLTDPIVQRFANAFDMAAKKCEQ